MAGSGVLPGHFTREKKLRRPICMLLSTLQRKHLSLFTANKIQPNMIRSQVKGLYTFVTSHWITLKLFYKWFSPQRMKTWQTLIQTMNAVTVQNLTITFTHIEAVHIFTLFKMFSWEKLLVLKIKCVVAVSLVSVGFLNHCSWKGSTYLPNFLSFQHPHWSIGSQIPLNDEFTKSSFTYGQILKYY